jgi:hypothetical protein
LWLLVGSLAIVGAIIFVRLIRTLRTGAQLNHQLLSGKFDDTAVGKQFAAWFAGNPNREIQRDKFVRFALLMGSSGGRVGERVLHCIMQARKEPRLGFGSIIADELDKLIVFDQPSDADQAQKQKAAIDQIDSFKKELRLLDQL